MGLMAQHHQIEIAFSVEMFMTFIDLFVIFAAFKYLNEFEICVAVAAQQNIL